jgi:hypothetical protein
LDAGIFVSIATVGVAMLYVLLDPSYSPPEQWVRQGTVTIQQLADVDSVTGQL